MTVVPDKLLNQFDQVFNSILLNISSIVQAMYGHAILLEGGAVKKKNRKNSPPFYLNLNALVELLDILKLYRTSLLQHISKSKFGIGMFRSLLQILLEQFEKNTYSEFCPIFLFIQVPHLVLMILIYL